MVELNRVQVRAQTDAPDRGRRRRQVAAAAVAVLAAVLAPGAATPAGADAATRAGAPTLGRTAVGKLKTTGGSGYIALSGPYTLDGTATVSALTGYVAGGIVAQQLRAVVYANSRNRPGAFVAASSEVTIGREAPAAWVDFPIAGAPALDPGEYWLGYWFGGSTAQEYYAEVTAAGRYASASYSSTHDPSATFGTGGGSPTAFSLYATLDPVAGPARRITITSPARDVPDAPAVATTAISRDECTLADGARDVFHIPYIQTGSSLSVAASVAAGALPPGGGVRFVLDRGRPTARTAFSLQAPFRATFSRLEKGEHTLDVWIVDAARHVRAGALDHDRAIRIGIGDVVVAIGDSVTEGYVGRVWDVPPYTSWLEAPVRSPDGRNYPQCGIGTGGPRDRLQEASYLVALARRLERFAGYPVFVLNEGVNGITSGGYLERLSDPHWQARIAALEPNRWLVDLGINDGQQGVPKSTFRENMQAIVDTLQSRDGAEPDQIAVALPSHGRGWEPYVAGLVRANGLGRGPDFETFYANHASDNPPLTLDVHPTVAGHAQMARLWALSLTHPRNVSVSRNAHGAVELSWDSLAAVEPTIAGYRVEYGTSPGVYTQSVDAGDRTSVTLPALPGRHYFAVVGYDDDAYAPNTTAPSPAVSTSPARGGS